jgi:hypothetical protein
MKRSLWALTLAGLASLAGCMTPAELSPDFALAAFGRPALDDVPGRYRLGAGDALGEEIFVTYVASLGLRDEIYATGRSAFPPAR